MEYSLWNNFRLSKLMLGTVQFGMPYGIANCTGQPEYHDVVAIVDTAFNGGVNCFDTAAAYGVSEAVLGRAIRDLRIQDKVFIATKVSALSLTERADPDSAEAAIRRSVEQSLRNLDLDCLHLVLFHRESDAAHLDILEQLKFEGKLLHAGVSCDNQPGAAMNLTDDSRVSALQLPGNVLDRRHQTSQVFRQAQTRNIAVFIRSVFLQGLLALSQDNIPEKLREIIPVRKSLERIAAEAGIKLTELAARYMLSQSGVTSILVGVETVDQVNANLEMFSGDVLPADILSAIDLLKIDLSETILTPSMW